MRARTGRMACVALGTAAVLVYGGSVAADHAWGNYHWARTSSSFSLTVVNSTTSDWDGYVSNAIADWSKSGVLDMVEELGVSQSTVRTHV